MADISDEEKNDSEFEDDEKIDLNEVPKYNEISDIEPKKTIEEISNELNQDDNISGIFTENKSQLPPEELLNQLSIKSYKNSIEMQKFDKICCLALSKIVYGEAHWKVAEAHIELAISYLKEKKFPQQTLKHVKLALDILLSVQEESSEVQLLLQKLYLAMGRAYNQLRKYKVAENCFQKAKVVSDRCNVCADMFLKVKVNIMSCLSKTACKMGQMGQAAEYLEYALTVADKISTNKNSKMAKLYIQIINLELMNDKHINVSTANEAGLNALKHLNISNNKKKTAQVHLLLSRVESKKEIVDYATVEYHIQEALKVHVEDNDMDQIISLQSMLCKVLIQQSRYTEAKEALLKCIEDCEINYGDMSVECAELYELIGSLSLEQKNFSHAMFYLTKAEEIFSGKSIHKARQEKLLKVIDIIRKASKDESMKTGSDKLKERPRFT
ncbi:tetratricopeptide repeat protein 23 isoform X1 [Hydra vulgaris]|uniref:Tetratricopeptide repeat protein 23 n=1 Tax=Hydra vulgaris TaxID=6087 RepID=T2MC64_HYDVU|nr:tetratricopeptide repeat protein 23 [Hydra vulgaris]